MDSFARPPDIASALLEITAEVPWVRHPVRGMEYWQAPPDKARRYHLPPGEAPYGSWEKLVHPDDRGQAVTAYRKALQNTSVTFFEQTYRVGGKGGYYPIHERLKVERDEAGNPVRVVGVWRDLDDRPAGQDVQKAQEEKIEELQKSLRSMQASVSECEFMLNRSQEITRIGSWKIDLRTGKTSCSEEFYALHGIDKNFDLHDPVLFMKTLYGARYGAAIVDGLEKLKAEGIPLDLVVPALTSLRLKKWLRLVAYPFYQGDDITGIVGIVHDITVFKETEQRLRASEEKFQTLFRLHPDFVALTRERDRTIVEVNDKSKEVLGYTREEMLGKTTRDLGLWVEPSGWDTLFRLYFKHGQVNFETRWRKKNGERIYVTIDAVQIGIGGEHYLLAVIKDITARKEAERKFNTTFSLSPDLMAIVREKDTVIADVNEIMTDMLGYTREEVLGRTTKDMDLWVVPEERERYFELYRRDQKVSLEARWRKKNGEEIFVLISAARVELYDEYYLLTAVKDISTRKQAEEKFKAAFSLSPDMISIVREHDSLIVDVNHKIYDVLGYTRDEMVGREALSFDIWVHPEEMEKYLQGLRKNREITFECKWRNKYGKEVDILISSAIIELAGERHALSITRDITERKLAEEKFSKAFNLSPDTMIIIRERDMVVVDANDKITWLTGLTREAVIGRKSTEISIALEADRDHYVEKYRAKGEVTLESQVNTGPGHAYVSISANRIELAGEHHVLLIVRDITDRVARDREVVKNLEQLAEARKRIGDLKLMALRSAMNPHFIFNALNSIQFFIAKNDRQQAIQYLSTFSKLIRGILSGSATNTIRLSDELELLRHYINLELVRFEKKFDVLFTIDPGIDTDAIEVPALLIQPFVENAILHGLYNKTTAGTLKISISRPRPHFIVFEVEDNGIGRVAARKLQALNSPQHKSMGISLAEERLKIVNADQAFSIETNDLYDGDVPAGTRVRMWLLTH